MKNLTKKTTGLLVIAFIVLGLTQEVVANFENNTSLTLVKDNLVGGWSYTVEGAPDGYESGLIMIVKVNEIYKVQVQMSGGAINGSDVVVKGNDITFKLMVEGERVSVSLSAKGSEITGTSTSSTGTYVISGTKSISPM